MTGKDIYTAAEELSQAAEDILCEVETKIARGEETRAKACFDSRLIRLLVRRDDSPTTVLDLETLKIVAHNCKVNPDSIGMLPFVRIEPILELSEILAEENATTEAKRLRNVYLLLLSCRRLKSAKWRNNPMDVIVPFHEDID